MEEDPEGCHADWGSGQERVGWVEGRSTLRSDPLEQQREAGKVEEEEVG